MNQLTYESEIIKEIITVIKVFNIRVDGYLPYKCYFKRALN